MYNARSKQKSGRKQTEKHKRAQFTNIGTTSHLACWREGWRQQSVRSSSQESTGRKVSQKRVEKSFGSRRSLRSSRQIPDISRFSYRFRHYSQKRDKNRADSWVN